MVFQRYLASQLCRPSGLIGKYIIGSLWNKRNAALNDDTFACLDLNVEDCVLDIGFGGGYLLERILSTVEQGMVAGTDVSPIMVKNGQRRWREAIAAGKVDLRSGKAEALPFPDGRFSKVCSVNSIFYWNDVCQGIAEMFRVLREEGKAVITFTCKKDLDQKWFVRYGVKAYNDDEVRKMMADAGFGEIELKRNRDMHREFVCLSGYKT